MAGHAVYVGSNYAQAANESVWFLEKYQKVAGQSVGGEVLWRERWWEHEQGGGRMSKVGDS